MRLRTAVSSLRQRCYDLGVEAHDLGLASDDLAVQQLVDLTVIERITLAADGREYLEYSCGLARSGDTAAIEVKLADNLDAVDVFFFFFFFFFF